MRSKILTGAAALTLATTAGLATTAPASAQYAQWNPGYAGADIVGGVVGGAIATATFPFWATRYYGSYDGYYPGYAYAPGYVYEPGYAYAPGYSYGYYDPYRWRYRHYRGGPHPR
jgi:hypothetical protein